MIHRIKTTFVKSFSSFLLICSLARIINPLTHSVRSIRGLVSLSDKNQAFRYSWPLRFKERWELRMKVVAMKVLIVVLLGVKSRLVRAKRDASIQIAINITDLRCPKPLFLLNYNLCEVISPSRVVLPSSRPKFDVFLFYTTD